MTAAPSGAERRRRERDVARAAALLLEPVRTDLERAELARLMRDDDVRARAKHAAVVAATKRAGGTVPARGIG